MRRALLQGELCARNIKRPLPVEVFLPIRISEVPGHKRGTRVVLLPREEQHKGIRLRGQRHAGAELNIGLQPIKKLFSSRRVPECGIDLSEGLSAEAVDIESLVNGLFAPKLSFCGVKVGKL